MRKIDELREGCIAKAGDQEMCFTLLSRDAAAPATIRFWINERVRLAFNQHGDKQTLEAYNCAVVMEIERGRYKPQPQSPTPEARLTNRDTTCAHCSRDMSVDPHARCSHGGICISIAEFELRKQFTPPEQRDSLAEKVCDEMIDSLRHNVGKERERRAAHPEAVRMPIELPQLDVTVEDKNLAWQNADPTKTDYISPGTLRASFQCRERQLLAALTETELWKSVYQATVAERDAERAAHERTRGELEQLQQSKLRMFVWDGRGKYKVVSCANSVSEARALALEEMSLRGDLLNMRGHVEHEQPLIYHRANAELALTESGETEELNICLEAETKRRQTAEAELELLRAERK